jgi:type IV secretory pathway VirB9-like protein
MKRAMMAGALAGAMGVSAVASDSSATWPTFNYSNRAQYDITCSAGTICEVELARGESLKGGQFVGETVGSYESWQHSSFVEGVQTDRGTELRPHLTFVASRPGLSASAVVSTDRHMYRFKLHSVDSDKPTYVSFDYPPAATPRPVVATSRPVSGRFASFPRPQPSPTPMDVAAQMARACAGMRDGYGSDAQPAEWRPERVCHSSSRTFIQLAASDTVPTDVPIPREVTDKGDANVVWTYDSRTRIYGVDLVPNEIVLTLGSGKRQMRMRVQRQKSSSSAVARTR